MDALACLDAKALVRTRMDERRNIFRYLWWIRRCDLCLCLCLCALALSLMSVEISSVLSFYTADIASRDDARNERQIMTHNLGTLCNGSS